MMTEQAQTLLNLYQQLMQMQAHNPNFDLHHYITIFGFDHYYTGTRFRQLLQGKTALPPQIEAYIKLTVAIWHSHYEPLPSFKQLQATVYQQLEPLVQQNEHAITMERIMEATNLGYYQLTHLMQTKNVAWWYDLARALQWNMITPANQPAYPFHNLAAYRQLSHLLWQVQALNGAVHHYQVAASQLSALSQTYNLPLAQLQNLSSVGKDKQAYFDLQRQLSEIRSTLNSQLYHLIRDAYQQFYHADDEIQQMVSANDVLYQMQLAIRAPEKPPYIRVRSIKRYLHDESHPAKEVIWVDRSHDPFNLSWKKYRTIFFRPYNPQHPRTTLALFMNQRKKASRAKGLQTTSIYLTKEAWIKLKVMSNMMNTNQIVWLLYISREPQPVTAVKGFWQHFSKLPLSAVGKRVSIRISPANLKRLKTLATQWHPDATLSCYLTFLVDVIYRYFLVWQQEQNPTEMQTDHVDNSASSSLSK